VTRQAVEGRLPIGQRNADQIDHTLGAARQISAQTQQPLALPAEGIETDTDGPAIGPQHLIALKRDPVFLPIPGWVSSQQNG